MHAKPRKVLPVKNGTRCVSMYSVAGLVPLLPTGSPHPEGTLALRLLHRGPSFLATRAMRNHLVMSTVALTDG